jgi:DNA (cytosine-5)-methyltransferase 1
MSYTCIDSFSGAGGLSLGLAVAGYDILLAFDNDPVCIETQRRNRAYFAHNSIVANITKINVDDPCQFFGIEPGELFLLAGGPPCQGFSVQRRGSDVDERNDLVLQYAKLVLALRPNYFLMENVSGIAGKRGRAFLSELFDITAKAGYWIHRKLIDAADYGVPQRRVRLFLVGERMDSPIPFFKFPNPTTPDETQRNTVRSAIGHLPIPPEDGSDYPGIPHHRRDRLSEINQRRLMALQEGQGREYLPEELLANCHRVSAEVIGHRNVYGRMAWDQVSPTITAKFDSFTRGKFGHPDQIRSISLREGALLQTFPADFLFAGTKVEVARQIGNAVPPRLAELLGRQIINCDREKKRLENIDEF